MGSNPILFAEPPFDKGVRLIFRTNKGAVMNHLSSHLNDRVFIENSTGERAGPYASIIDSKNGLSALILEEKLDVEEGWKTIRSLPNGKEETYTIMEATYSPGMGEGIPPFWTLRRQAKIT